MEDSVVFSNLKSSYKPDQWVADIESGWSYFKKNICSTGLNADPNLDVSLDSISPNKFFPPRLLTKSEQSIAARHILAIEMTAKSDIPCIILEDDALVSDQNIFHELLHYLRRNYKRQVFFDLADRYIPLNINENKTLSIGNLHFCLMPIAITRTLMAYAISPEVARALLKSLSYYSLPIDMQFQVSLSKLFLPGLSLTNSPFIHGSKCGDMTSSVLQC